MSGTTLPHVDGKETIEMQERTDGCVEDMAALAADYTPGSEDERRFLRKIDRRILVRLAEG